MAVQTAHIKTLYGYKLRESEKGCPKKIENLKDSFFFTKK